jgi:hypothetical protein
MWPYKEISRAEFELIKDKVERTILRLGGIVCDVPLPYTDITTSIHAGTEVSFTSNSPTYWYNGCYYHVSEVCFSKPFVVIECGDYDDLIHNRMEDADPFPYDLPDALLENEVKYSLGILPYPGN